MFVESEVLRDAALIRKNRVQDLDELADVLRCLRRFRSYLPRRERSLRHRDVHLSRRYAVAGREHPKTFLA